MKKCVIIMKITLEIRLQIALGLRLVIMSQNHANGIKKLRRYYVWKLRQNFVTKLQ